MKIGSNSSSNRKGIVIAFIEFVYILLQYTKQQTLLT